MGHFDFLQHPKPFAAICACLDNLVDQLVLLLDENSKDNNNQEELQAIRQAIIQTPAQTKTLLEMFPSLERILPRTNNNSENHCSHLDPTEPENNGNSTNHQQQQKHQQQQQQRFVMVFRTLLAALCQPSRPIVMVLQHLQWADVSSLMTLVSMATDARDIDLFIVGTVDDTNDRNKNNEYLLHGDANDNDNDDNRWAVFAGDNERQRSSATRSSGHSSSYLMMAKTLREIELKSHSTIVHVAVGNLDLAAMQQWIMDGFKTTLSKNDDDDDKNNNNNNVEKYQSLARVVHDSTGGNLLFGCEFLEWLQESDLLYYDQVAGDDRQSCCWTWDLDFVDDPPTSIHALYTNKLQRQLSPDTLQLVKVASCLGSQLEPDLLQYILGPIHIQDCVNEAVKKGVLVLQHNIRYAFVHFLIQQAAYELIPEHELELFHTEIGRRLWRKLNANELDQHIFVLLSQFNVGKRLITREKERKGIATLCLHAGRKAARFSTFHIALVCLNLGIELVGERGWRDEYDLTLALFNAGAEMELCAANFEGMNELIDQTIKNARCERDKVQAVSTRMYALGLSNKQDQSIDIGLQFVKQFGVIFPSHPSKLRVVWEMKRISRRLQRWTNEQILRLPTMENDDELACIRIMQIMSLHCLMARPLLSALLTMKSITITLKHGLCAMSAACFAAYGMFCFSSTGDFKAGLRYGHLSLTLLEKFGSIEYIPRVYGAYYGVISPCMNSIRQSLQPLQKGYRIGLHTGDVEFASICARTFLTFSMASGAPLGQVYREGISIRDTMMAARAESALGLVSPMLQACHNLMGLSVDPLAPSGDIFDFDRGFEEAMRNHQYPRARHIRFCRTLVAYIFCEYELADKFKTCEHIYFRLPPVYDFSWAVFFGGMTAVAMAAQGKNKSLNLRLARKALREIEYRAGLSPYNFLGKEHLLRAEVFSVVGDNVNAAKSYISAIAVARDTGILLDHALSNERAGRHFRRIGEMRRAEEYLRAALLLYREWGAEGKTVRLAAEIDALFRV